MKTTIENTVRAKRVAWGLTVLLALCIHMAANSKDLADETADLSEESVSFMIANTLWTVAHELGHALIAEFNAPFLGSEENIADMVATVALLQQHPAHPDGAYPEHGEGDYDDYLIATATGWRIEDALDDEVAMWDTHLLDLQRSHNIVCLTYGSDPERFADLPRTMGLPFTRAAGCAEEYESAVAGINQHIGLYGRSDDSDASDGKKIALIYDKPATQMRATILEHLLESRILEVSAARVETLFALPNDLKIVVLNCLGDDSAFWRKDLREIIICYEFLERLIYLSRFQHCVSGMTGQMVGRDEKTRECVKAEMSRDQRQLTP